MVDGNFGIVTVDPLCDAMYAVCDDCPTRSSCDYFASGQVAQCSSATSVVMETHPAEYAFGIDERIEERFDQMIKDNRLQVICDQTPRRSGYRGHSRGRSC